MKKTIGAISICVIVVVLMATAVSFAFFSNRDAVTNIDLDSENIVSFTIGYSEAVHILKPKTARADNSFLVDKDANVARFLLQYSTVETSYSNMHIESTALTYKQKNSESLPSDSVNAKYLSSIIEFGFANIASEKDLDTVALPTDWHTLTPLAITSHNIGVVAAGTIGYLVMFVRLNAVDELIPPMAKELRVIITVESSEF